MRPSPFVVILAAFVVACDTDVVPTLPDGSIATVEVFGPDRLKVGDPYVFSAIARDADGAIVTAPVTWRVVEAGRGTISANGVYTPAGIGAVTVRATVGGVSDVEGADVYDWEPVAAANVIGALLRADAPVIDRMDRSELPVLVVGCTGGVFVVMVTFEHMLVSGGAVAYIFDQQAPETATWNDFGTHLILPGATNTVRGTFASRLAAARQWQFAFIEHMAGAHLAPFRVTGLQQRLGPMLTACAAQTLPVLTDSVAASR